MALANATLLHHLQDRTPTALTTDASKMAIGAILEQEFKGLWRPIAFYSKKLKPTETRYSVYLPPDRRWPAFDILHSLSHPSIWVTRHMVSSRFV